MLAGALHSGRQRAAKPARLRGGSDRREILQPLSPAQPCVPVVAAWREEQQLQFWDFWIGLFFEFRQSLREIWGEGGVGPASPPYLQIPSALTLGNRHGLSMGSDV